MMQPITIPIIIPSGLLSKLLSTQTPSNVSPTIGINIRQVVSPMSRSNKTTVEASGGVFGASPSGFDVLMYLYTVSLYKEFENNKMPRKHQSLPHQRYEAPMTCEEKRRFRTEADALKAAEIQMLTDMQLELHVYQCFHCRQWHLTRSKN